MQLIDLIFLGILSASIALSLYLAGSFLLTVRAHRKAVEAELADAEWVPARIPAPPMILSTPPARSASKDIVLGRRRRMRFATPEPDLVLVNRGRFAAVVLPIITESDTYEAIQCRLSMN